MAAATADRDGKRQDGELKAYQVAASTTIYKDTLVGVTAAGYLAPLAHGTAGLIFVGVAIEKTDNSAGTAGAKSCRVRKKGEYEFAYNGGDATIALLGDEVYAVDDQTVDEDAVVTTNDYKVGAITEFISATKVRIRVDNYCK